MRTSIDIASLRSGLGYLAKCWSIMQRGKRCANLLRGMICALISDPPDDPTYGRKKLIALLFVARLNDGSPTALRIPIKPVGFTPTAHGRFRLRIPQAHALHTARELALASHLLPVEVPAPCSKGTCPAYCVYLRAQLLARYISIASLIRSMQ